VALSTEEDLLYPVYSYPNCFGGDWPETVETMGMTFATLAIATVNGTNPVALGFSVASGLWVGQPITVVGVGGGVDGPHQVLTAPTTVSATIDAVGTGTYTNGTVVPSDRFVGVNLAEGLFLAERDVLMPANPFITLSTTVSTIVSTTVTVTTTVTTTVSPTITPVVGLPVFKLYADGSRLEWMACGADQRSAYQQTTLSTLMAPRI
jgi:hypothetical protein